MPGSLPLRRLRAHESESLARSMAKKRSSRGTQALQALEGAGVSFTLHPYEPDPGEDGYGLAAARALGVDPGRVFKTLIASLAPGDALVVAMVPVDKQLDLKALARAAGAKSASLADPALAERTTGYILGGISPLGQRQVLRTFIDSGAPTAGSVYVSAGRRGLQLEIDQVQLVDLTRAESAPIGRLP